MRSIWSVYDESIYELLPDYGEQWMEAAKAVLAGTDRSKNEIEKLADYIRKNKKRFLDEYKGVHDHAEVLDIDLTTVKDGWLKHKKGSFRFINRDFIEPEAGGKESLEHLRIELVKDLQQYAPSFPKLERIEDDRAHLLVISPCDVHIGKLCSAFETGETYNNQMAVKRVRDGVSGILNKVQSFNIDKILFIGGNDILHVDNANKTTTKGTPQDVSGMWHENFILAKQLYIEVLEKLLSVADVHFSFNPSNHDYTNGFFLVQVIETYFRNCPNITFDCSLRHRKGFQYHNNLIGSSHGDGAKPTDLPLLMAQEFPMEWAYTKHRYVYIHHLHHKIAKDYIGITVENLRSPSPADAYHHKNGYQHAPQAIEAFLHDKNHGQIARINHIF